MKIDMSLTNEEILNQWAQEIQKNNPEFPFRKAKELAKKTMGWLSCPAHDGVRMTPMACMYCPFGHMTDCHHPYTCDEAECSHYHQDIVDNNYDFEDEVEN